LRRLNTLGCLSLFLRRGKPVNEVFADDVFTYGSDLILSEQATGENLNERPKQIAKNGFNHA
jgi:hypothetical protein